MQCEANLFFIVGNISLQARPPADRPPVFALTEGRTPAALPAAFRPGKESVRFQAPGKPTIWRWFTTTTRHLLRLVVHLVVNFHLQFL